MNTAEIQGIQNGKHWRRYVLENVASQDGPPFSLPLGMAFETLEALPDMLLFGAGKKLHQHDPARFTILDVFGIDIQEHTEKGDVLVVQCKNKIASLDVPPWEGTIWQYTILAQ